LGFDVAWLAVNPAVTARQPSRAHQSEELQNDSGMVLKYKEMMHLPRCLMVV
jgi:hypothetical protein